METERDFLDELVEERTASSPEYRYALDAAVRMRALVKALAEARERSGLTQAEVAKRMGTSQSAVARLERVEADPRLSTVERYAQALGWRLEALPTG